jgi:hypothetical protein
MRARIQLAVAVGSGGANGTRMTQIAYDQRGCQPCSNFNKS